MGRKHGKLQGIEDLAGSGGADREDLHNNSKVPSRGEIFSDLSDSEGSSVNISQHSRGMGKRKDRGIYSISEGRVRLSHGVGDSFNNLS